MFQENSIETCILSRVKQITSPGWMHETSARTWCTGKTQRERVEREVGGGIGMGNTCKPMAISFQCMTKFTTKKKKRAHRCYFFIPIKNIQVKNVFTLLRKRLQENYPQSRPLTLHLLQEVLKTKKKKNKKTKQNKNCRLLKERDVGINQ